MSLTVWRVVLSMCGRVDPASPQAPALPVTLNKMKRVWKMNDDLLTWCVPQRLETGKLGFFN